MAQDAPRPRGLQRLVGATRGVVDPRHVASPLVMARVLAALPDRPAVELVMQAFGYRTPAYRLGMWLERHKRKAAEFRRRMGAQ